MSTLKLTARIFSQNRNAVASGLRSIAGDTGYHRCSLITYLHLRNADPTLPRYGSDFIICWLSMLFSVIFSIVVDFLSGMDNETIARRFFQLSTLMEIRGDDPFRLRSYRNAAEAIEVWPTQMQEIVAAEGVAGLQTIPGVGKAIAGKVGELLERGTFDAWERITAETPATVLELLEVPGIGPKTAALLHQRFKVSSLPDLKKFVAGGGLDMVDGIGPRTAEKIRLSLELM